MTHSHKELRELLPWYVNGTLDAATRQELETQLEHSAALRSELVWLRVLRSQVREQMQADVNARSPSTGLDNLMALIHAEQSGKVSPMRKRFSHWAATARRLPLSVGIAAAVLLSQAVIIGALLGRPTPDAALQPMSGGTGLASGEMLQVTFKPQATEAQIRALLAGVQGEIVAGPGALGIYAVRVPDHQGQQALQSLRQDAQVIDSVSLMPGR